MSDTNTTYTGELPITQERWEAMDAEILEALTDIATAYGVVIDDVTVVNTDEGLKVSTEAIRSLEEAETADAGDN